MHHATTPILISVDFSQQNAHLFRVTMHLEAPAERQRLSLPVWTPGSYMVREFAQHIVGIAAFSGEHHVPVYKVDKNTFELGTTSSSSSVSIVYDVYGFDSSIRAAYMDNTMAFFNGCALFLRPHGREHEPYMLKLVGETVADQSFHVATGMPAVDVDKRGFGTYQAASYDELVDYPFMVSAMKRISFSACGVPHEIYMVGDVRPFNEARLVRDLSSLCEAHINFFGGTAPFASYTFIARFEEGSYGGLEHRNSTMVLSSPACLPHDEGEPDVQYRSFLGLCSHEYFHSWNIKRLKPKNFIPFDYDRESYTTMLWIFEGVTSYYDDLALVRAGLISRESYLDMMSKNLSKLLRNSGRFRQSLAEASHDAWIKFYRPNENSNNACTSYYLNGSFIALYLDLLIRAKSAGKKSLDDVVQEAYGRYHEQGMSEDQFFALLDDIGGLADDNIKQRFIYNTEEPSLVPMLASVGVNMTVFADELTIDDRTRMHAYLGFKFRFDDNGRALVVQVDDNSPAQHAGLCPNDEIIAINGVRLEQAHAAELLASIREHHAMDVLYARKKLVRPARLSPVALPKTRAQFALLSTASGEQKKMLDAWLGAR